MDTLSDVSETALITLRARVIEANREEPVIRDDIGAELLIIAGMGHELPPEVLPRVVAAIAAHTRRAGQEGRS